MRHGIYRKWRCGSGSLRSMEQKGMSVPKDVFITGADNISGVFFPFGWKAVPDFSGTMNGLRSGTQFPLRNTKV